LADELEVVIGIEAAAGSVRGPFVLDQMWVGHDVGHGGWVGEARCGGAVLGIAVHILRPQAMHHEAVVSALALRTAGVTVAELWRPGESQDVVIEHSRLTLLSSLCGPMVM